MPIYALGERRPTFRGDYWIADNSVVIGDVTIGNEVSVWYNVTIRGDMDPIAIGDGTNIQDGSVLHTDEGVPMVIGERVVVGHQVMLHGCTIGDRSLIGIGAVVLNNAVIGKDCLIGANALVPEGKVIPDRSLVLGSPGKVVRQLTDEDLVRMAFGAQHYIDNYKDYREKLVRLD